MNVFNKTLRFNYDFYNEIEYINDPTFDFSKYKKNVIHQFEKVKKVYPLLNLVFLPTTLKSTAMIQGYLINYERLQTLGLNSVNDYLEYGMEILIIVPFDFLSKGVRVFDVNNFINVDAIPKKYRHFRNSPNKRVMLCTHKENDIKKNNAVLGVVQSAEHLLLEYKKYVKTGVFDLECWPH